MKQNTIPTLHRMLASVLFISQLLTSCGGTEIILLSATSTMHELSSYSDDSDNALVSPSPLAIPDAQGYESAYSHSSFNSLHTYITRQGHEIKFFQEGDQFLARVQEQLPPGISSSPHILPVHFQQGLFPEDLTPDAYVDVVFPRQSNGNKGYVFCAEYGGLKGGRVHMCR